MAAGAKRTVTGLLAALALAAPLALVAAPAARAGEATTALVAAPIADARWVRGSDGRPHVEYDLVLTNAYTRSVTLRAIDVLDERGHRLHRLAGDELAAATTALLDSTPTRTVRASATVTTVLDVPLPAGRERALPSRLTHRIAYAYPRSAPLHQLIGSSLVSGPEVRVDRRRPLVISPPLRGPGWLAINACCEPSGHRSFVLGVGGALRVPETFAIDYVRARDGRAFTGDGRRNEQWFGYDATIHAVAPGTVVAVRSTMPEVPPFMTTARNRTVVGPGDFAGNHVVVRIRPGVYAFYAHMVPRSATVRVGQRVATGQVLGRLGNSGNTTAPHLHFGLNTRVDPLAASSVPYVFDRFTLGGVATLTGAFRVTVTGPRRAVRNVYPLSRTVNDFQN